MINMFGNPRACTPQTVRGPCDLETQHYANKVAKPNQNQSAGNGKKKEKIKKIRQFS